MKKIQLIVRDLGTGRNLKKLKIKAESIKRKITKPIKQIRR